MNVPGQCTLQTGVSATGVAGTPVLRLAGRRSRQDALEVFEQPVPAWWSDLNLQDYRQYAQYSVHAIQR